MGIVCLCFFFLFIFSFLFFFSLLSHVSYSAYQYQGTEDIRSYSISFFFYNFFYVTFLYCFSFLPEWVAFWTHLSTNTKSV